MSACVGKAVGNDLGNADFDARYRWLRAHYLSELPQRREAVSSLWADAMRDPTSPAWHELHALAHRLSGSAPCYGLDAIGETAQELDRLFSAKPPCREVFVLRPTVLRLLERLDAAIAADGIGADGSS